MVYIVHFNVQILLNYLEKAGLLGQLRDATGGIRSLGKVEKTISTTPFHIGDMTFEVGGRKKGQKQIESANQGYIVKDDINTGYGNIIPLWMFGLMY